MKATEGVGFTDKMMETHMQNVLSMKGNSALYGFYHFARPDLGNSAKAEADAFLKKIDKYKEKAMLALDLECANWGKYAEWVKEWLTYVYQKTGSRPLLYMPGAYAQNYKAVVKETNTGVWACSSLGYYSGLPVVMTQTQENGIDVDVFYGSATAWMKYVIVVGQTPTTAGVSTVSIKSNDAVADEVISGKWGNGNERKTRLENAGYNYATIQNLVNAKLKKSASPVYYTVRKNDTLSQIALSYKTTVSALQRLNNIKDVNYIRVGQKLRIK